MAPFQKGVFAPQNSLFFDNMNAGKLGLALNLSCEEGREVARDLVSLGGCRRRVVRPAGVPEVGPRLRVPARHQARPHHDQQQPLRPGRSPLRRFRLRNDGCGHLRLYRPHGVPRTLSVRSLQRLHRHGRPTIRPSCPPGRSRPPPPHGGGPVHRPLTDRECAPLPQPLAARLPAHGPRRQPHRQPRPRHGSPRGLPQPGR